MLRVMTMSGHFGRVWASVRRAGLPLVRPFTGRSARAGKGSPELPASGRRRSALLNPRSVAGQVFLLQSVIVVLLVAAAGLALVLQARSDSTRDATNRSMAVAQSFAAAPGVAAGLTSPDPTAALQAHAEQVGKTSGVTFVAVLSRSGIRLTDPDPTLIGKHAEGDLRPVLAGQSIATIYRGAPNDAVRAVAPVYDATGHIVGMVSAGISIANVMQTVDRELPVLVGCAAVALALAMGGAGLVSGRLLRQTHGLLPAEVTRMYEHHNAVLHAVREGVLIIGEDRRLVLANDEARRLLDLPADAEGRPVAGLGLGQETAELLGSDRVASDEVQLAGDRLLAVNYRPAWGSGGALGSVATLRDTTELRALAGSAEVARERMQLLYDAGVRIGTTLDVVRTAQELVELAVPRFADVATVDLLEPVLRGAEPDDVPHDTMRRTAVAGAGPGHPLYQVGEVMEFAPATVLTRGLASRRAVLVADLTASEDWHAEDPSRARRIMGTGLRSLITVPMRARGVVLGLANFWRAAGHEPFAEDDLSSAEELVARAAVCIDNARRYSREHAMAVTLQRSLLPRGVPEQHALEVAFRYLPAQAGVGGDWFDILPLSGARVALVVGDVVGHGLHAAATMGRLRTAVHNFSALDLAPEELLGHLDELVARIDQDETVGNQGEAVTGATLLYAIYDPVGGVCTAARAGHPPPLVVRPDGTVHRFEVPGGPPLGLGGMPFEAAEARLPEGGRLVLFTDGLVESRDRDIDTGLRLLCSALARADRSPEQTCADVLSVLLPTQPSDDIVLLVARTRVLSADQIAEWAVPAEPAAVAPVRAECVERLTEWGLEELSFTTELIISELLTNAIRYAGQPITVRLLRSQYLTCEVSDASSTSPHLRHAAATDEGGRGLYLVAQLAQRWGTRYTASGKIIWTEQALPGNG
jgi:serine phosphatase RsbU (regulator of sigma subunit)/PAS domain-containing protein/anti-sigma regulatory factor (Ser/Thr protein kinase)